MVKYASYYRCILDAHWGSVHKILQIGIHGKNKKESLMIPNIFSELFILQPESQSLHLFLNLALHIKGSTGNTGTHLIYACLLCF